MDSFYSKLRYSFGNEDWKTERQALKIKSNDRVLCITASGDRPLNLLINELSELITVDLNPIQSALFDLKRAAIQNFSYQDYLAFLGVNPHNKRRELFSQIQDDLSEASRLAWIKNERKIVRGVLFEGVVEKLLISVSFFLKLFRGKKIKTLFSFDDIEKQRTFLQTSWHSYPWKKLFEIALRPWIMRLCIKDPGLYAYVSSNINMGMYIYDKIHDPLNKFLAKESILFSLLLQGNVDHNHFPPYLSEAGTKEIKKQLHKVKFETLDILSYLKKSPDNYFDCFSCSDIASYVSKSYFEELLREIIRTAKPKARFCMRQFLSDQKIVPSLASNFVRNDELEQKLEHEDRCFGYKFMCGVVIPK